MSRSAAPAAFGSTGRGWLVGLAAIGGGCAMAACGSRGPLDFDVAITSADASSDVVAVDAAGEAAAADAARDARAEAGPSLAQCGSCVAQQCGASILACVQNPGCQRIFQCVAQQCLSSGTPSPSCLVQCAGGDLRAAAQVLAIYTCITSSCGADCTAVLGGLGGGFPGGGGGGRDSGGGRRDAGQGGDASPSDASQAEGGQGLLPGTPIDEPRDLHDADERRHSLERVLSQWPELCAPSD
jgi:hypothetical protein